MKSGKENLKDKEYSINCVKENQQITHDFPAFYKIFSNKWVKVLNFNY